MLSPTRPTRFPQSMAKMVMKKVLCSECGKSGEFSYEILPGWPTLYSFGALTNGFTVRVSAAGRALVKCDCGCVNVHSTMSKAGSALH
jgi:hypothetical protein